MSFCPEGDGKPAVCAAIANNPRFKENLEVGGRP